MISVRVPYFRSAGVGLDYAVRKQKHSAAECDVGDSFGANRRGTSGALLTLRTRLEEPHEMISALVCRLDEHVDDAVAS